MQDTTAAEPFEARRYPAVATAIGEGSPAEVRDAVEDAISSLEPLYRVCRSFLSRRAEDQPYVILGASFGVGFVLGGGLASRLGGLVVNTLGRAALAHSIDVWSSLNSSHAEEAPR